MANLSPVTGQPFCEVAKSTPEDVELALDAAHAAKDAWGETSLAERAAVLNAIADAIEANLEMLAVAESWENGKPVRETLARGHPAGRRPLPLLRRRHPVARGPSTEIDKDTVAYHFHEPLGVVGQIIPFNFPLLMAAWKIAPALAAGNCTVVKPASPTPWSILKLAEVIEDVVPPGVHQHRDRPGRRDRQGPGHQPAHRQDRLHRRDRHRTADHAVRGGEPHPVDHGARRQVAQHLLRRRDGRGRRRSWTRRSRAWCSTPSTRARCAPARRARSSRSRSTTSSWRAASSASARSSRATRWTPTTMIGAAGLGPAAREDHRLRRHRPPGGRRGASSAASGPTSTESSPTATTSSRRC